MFYVFQKKSNLNLCVTKTLKINNLEMKFKKILLFLLLLNSLFSDAQTTLQVVTKSVEKTLPAPVGTLLNLDAEKADVTLRTDSRSRDVTIKIELIARHPQLDVAKHDLDALKIITEKIGNKIYIRNYIAVAKGTAKPSADLRTRYTVTLPPDLNITLKNTFGKLNASDLTNNLEVTAEFCKIQLTNIKGNTALTTRFGDIEGDKLDGKTTISSVRTDISLNLLRGPCTIKTQFGKIKITADRSLSALAVTAEKADITFDPPDGSPRFTYNLNAEYGKVTTPIKWEFKYLEKSKQREKAQLTGTAALVNLNTTFGQIVINQ